MICLKINIRGKVYKTGLRYFLKQQASSLGIVGYVYYTSDNSVEVIGVGTKFQLDEFIRLCHAGNKDSKIEHVSMKKIPYQEFTSFEVHDSNEKLI